MCKLIPIKTFCFIERFLHLLLASALTGESLPVTKNLGESMYSAPWAMRMFMAIPISLIPISGMDGNRNFCICGIAIGMYIKIVVIYGIKKRSYLVGISNYLSYSSAESQSPPRLFFLLRWPLAGTGYHNRSRPSTHPIYIHTHTVKPTQFIKVSMQPRPMPDYRSR